MGYLGVGLTALRRIPYYSLTSLPMQITHNKQRCFAPCRKGRICNCRNYGCTSSELSLNTSLAVFFTYFSTGHDSNVELQPIFPIPIAGLIYHLPEVCSRFIAVRHLRPRRPGTRTGKETLFFAATTWPSIVGHSEAVFLVSISPEEGRVHACVKSSVPHGCESAICHG